MNELLRQLGAAVGVPNLAVDEKGACSLRIDGEVFTFRHEEDRGEIIFVHQLAALPSSDSEKLALFTFLLERNCVFRGVGPGILGISLEDNGVFYAARLATAGLAYPDFERYLQAVVDICDSLRGEMIRRMANRDTGPAYDGKLGFGAMLRV